MSNHAAPESWLDRWRDAEPLRLYLWTVASLVLAAASVAGWLTGELYVAVTGVAAAVLMVGGTETARRETYARRTVTRLLDQEWESAYTRGYATGQLDPVERTPEQVARELGAYPAEQPTEQAPVVEQTQLQRQAEQFRRDNPRPSPHPRERPGGTELMPTVGAGTAPRSSLPPCGYVEAGRPCILRRHPAETEHRFAP